MVFDSALLREIAMRAFLVACVAAIVIAAAAAILLQAFVQEPSSKSFSTSAVRL
jgi:hypothetical protein